MDKQYFLCETNDRTKFSPTEMSDKLDALLDQLEYGDVKEGLYQIHEYPSGEIYSVGVDSEVEDTYYYTSRQPGVWMTTLTLIDTNKELVEKTKESYSN